MVMEMKILDFNRDGKVDSQDFKYLMLRYEIILVGGLLLTILPMLKIMGYVELDSDMFWLLAGVVITAEAILEIIKEKRIGEKDE